MGKVGKRVFFKQPLNARIRTIPTPFNLTAGCGGQLDVQASRRLRSRTGSTLTSGSSVFHAYLTRHRPPVVSGVLLQPDGGLWGLPDCLCVIFADVKPVFAAKCITLGKALFGEACEADAHACKKGGTVMAQDNK
ncbi:MAG: hypothetical protein RR323_06210, partial [Raoultibacter sp.]